MTNAKLPPKFPPCGVPFLDALREKHGTADFHVAQACEIFGITPDKVTHEQRLEGRHRNFRLLYGINIAEPK